MSDATYEKIPGQPFRLLRSDGEIVHAASKEVKAARAEGRAPQPNPDAAKKRGGKKLPAGDASAPKVAKPPPLESDEKPKKLTKREQAVEFGILAGLVFGGFSVATQRPHWALSNAEQHELGAALSSALPTLPAKTLQKIEKASPWIRLAMVSSNIVIPRMAQDARLAQTQVRPAAAQAQPRPAPPSGPPPGAFTRQAPAEAHVEPNGAVFGRQPVEYDGSTPGPIHVAPPPSN